MDTGAPSSRLSLLFEKLTDVREDVQSWSLPLVADEAVSLVQAARDFLSAVIQKTSATDIEVTQILVETSGASASLSEKFSFDLDLYLQILSSNCIIKTEDNQEIVLRKDALDQPSTEDAVAVETPDVSTADNGIEIQLESVNAILKDEVSAADFEGVSNTDCESLASANVKQENSDERPQEESGGPRKGSPEVGGAAYVAVTGVNKRGVLTKLCLTCHRSVPLNHLKRHAASCARMMARKNVAVREFQEEESGNLCCEACGKNFRFARNLRAHRIHIHGLKCDIPCSVCPRAFFSLREKIKHMVSLHGRRLHCEHCSFKTYKLEECEDHLKDMHQTESVDDECLEKLLSSDRETVKRHNKITCEKCGKRFVSGTYENHVTECSGPKESSSGGRSYLCTLCGKELRLQSGLQHHIKHVHNKQYTFPCSHCRQAYTHEIDRDQHVFSAHGINASNRVIYQCSKCPFQALRKYYVTKHERVTHRDASHESGTPYVCDICGKEFKKLSGLRTHEIRHKTEKHSCPRCDFKCKSWKLYVAHMDSQHVGWRSHTCPGRCGFRAGDRSSLNKHTKTCFKFNEFYKTVYDAQQGCFRCPGDGCSFIAYNKHVFFKHHKHCEKVVRMEIIEHGPE